jgi:predicted Rossmann fold nucleotide-binding protein DprA/Smf involved in DNA uptake
VPGNVGSPGSAGTNNLIRDGAKLVARSEDVLEDFIEQFNLKQVEKIVSSDKYLRYEYNTRIPVSPENLPIHPTAQKKPVPPPARESAVPQPKPKPPPKQILPPKQKFMRRRKPSPKLRSQGKQRLRPRRQRIPRLRKYPRRQLRPRKLCCWMRR